ncbi:hypothetical protein, partial [Escherichia coli]|uniref:hypothetical protein n=1 Tax=Escherichia coli TaxID=562 RepID=UPI001BC83673
MNIAIVTINQATRITTHGWTMLSIHRLVSATDYNDENQATLQLLSLSRLSAPRCWRWLKMSPETNGKQPLD